MQLEHRLVGRERAAGLGRLAQLPVECLDRVGRVDRSSHVGRKRRHSRRSKLEYGFGGQLLEGNCTAEVDGDVTTLTSRFVVVLNDQVEADLQLGKIGGGLFEKQPELHAVR
jgi:hypothetical protein